MTPDRTVTALAPAKVNLFLHVVGKRDDGYHLLESLVGFAEVADRLGFAPADGLGLRTTGRFAERLSEEAMAGDGEANLDGNLIIRAARGLQARSETTRGCAIALEKALPVAAGIGGGSADAAAAILGLCAFWGVNLPDADLAELATGLGADVPMCLDGRSALVTGIGERIEPVAGLGGTPIVLVNPGVPVSTGACFKGREGPYTEPGESADAIAREIAAAGGGPKALAAVLSRRGNDLGAPARRIEPLVDETILAIEAAPGCLLARMSGSGATCFGLFATDAEAETAAEQLTRDRPDWWVSATRLRTEPARPTLS